MKPLRLVILANFIFLMGCKTQDVFKDATNILTYKNEMFYHGNEIVEK